MSGVRLGLVPRVLRHLVLMTGTVAMLGPFVVMLMTSFKPKAEIFAPTFHLLPHSWGGTENYATALTQVPLLHFLLNGAIVTAAIFLLQVLVNVPAAYALAKRRFRGRDAMFATVLVCLLIPYQAIALPIYILFFSTEGGRADLVVWNPDERFRVEPAALRHRHALTPYAGRDLYGVVQETYVGGRCVFARV